MGILAAFLIHLIVVALPVSGCIHDDLEPSKYIRIETNHKSKRLSAEVAQPMRITADTHELDLDIANADVTS